MSIHIRCVCTWQGKVRASLAGRRVRCPDCRGVINIPLEVTVDQPLADPQHRRDSSSAKLVPNSSSAGTVVPQPPDTGANKPGSGMLGKTGKTSRPENPFHISDPAQATYSDSITSGVTNFEDAVRESQRLGPISAVTARHQCKVLCTPVVRLMRWGLEGFLLGFASLPMLATFGVFLTLPFLERNLSIPAPPASQATSRLRFEDVQLGAERRQPSTAELKAELEPDWNLNEGQRVLKQKNSGLTRLGWICLSATPLVALLTANWYQMQKGRTVARLLLGMTVIDSQTGKPATFGGMLLRMLVPLAVCVFTFGTALIVLLGDALLTFRSSRRRLLDDLLKTDVVHL